MIYIGDKKLKRCYLGSEAIGRVYRGENLLFPARVSRLPEGYTEIKYIQSSGTQYIDTGIIPQGGSGATDTKVTADMQPVSSEAGTTYYFGCTYNSGGSNPYYGAFGFYRFVASAGSAGSNHAVVRFSQGNINVTSIGPNRGTERMTLTLDGPNNRAYADDAYASVGTYVSGVPSIALFGLHFFRSGTAASYMGGMSAKLFSCTVEKGGALVREFVPCTDPTGVAGLYDLVEGEFYGNAGSGAFTAGPAV